MARKTSTRRSSISFVRILGMLALVVVPVLVLGFLVVQQANVLVGRSLLIAFGEAESTYRNAWFELDGDIVASDLVVYPDDGNRDVAVRFDSIHLDTPGWVWVLRNTFDRELAHAPLDRLHLTLAGVTSDQGVEPTLGDLGPVGALSASPFEAMGCLNDDLWTHSELEAMGLMPGRTTLEFDYQVKGQELLTAIVLRTPEVSTARLERREQLPAEVNVLLLDQSPGLVRSEHWQVQDQGFVKARNAWCAKKDGVDYRTFVARHVDTVVRVLEAGGLAADAASIEAYRGFAWEGGELAFGGEYPQPLRSDALYAARDSGAALLRMHAILERGGQRLAVQWRRFDPRPLQGLDDLTPYAAMQKERGIDPSGLPTAAASPTPAATATTATAAMQAQAASSTASAPVATTPASSPPAPAKTYASSLPTASTLAPPGTQLSWEELPRYEGHVLQVWTAHNPPRTMTLLSADAKELSVRARLGGGHANYRIGRSAFLRATLVQ
jgi:hypothetical protein